jgi:hypothetical protein
MLVPRYTRDFCMNLALKTPRLPRELRDMIYDQLLDDDFLNNVRDRMRDEFRSHQDPPADLALPHFFDQEFMGADFFSEVSHRTAEVSRNSGAPLVISIKDLSKADPSTIQCLGLPWHVFFRGVDIQIPLMGLLNAKIPLGKKFYSLQPDSNRAERSLVCHRIDRTLAKGLRPLGKSGGIAVMRMKKLDLWESLLELGRTKEEKMKWYEDSVACFAEELRRSGFGDVRLKGVEDDIWF